MPHSQAFLKLVESVMPRVCEVSVAELVDAKATLIDVREDGEWTQGHIPGAIHLGRGVIERDIEARVPDKTTPLILYCGGGYRSALAVDSLQNMGYTDVRSLAGGWKAWRENQPKS